MQCDHGGIDSVIRDSNWWLGFSELLGSHLHLLARKIGFPRACLNQRARQSVGMWVIPKWVSFGEAIETHRGVRACHKETPRLLPARLHSTDGRSRPFYPTGMKVMEDEMDPLQLAGGRLPWGVGSSDKVEE